MESNVLSFLPRNVSAKLNKLHVIHAIHVGRTFMYNDQREQFFHPTLGLASTGMSKGGKMSLGSGGRGPFKIKMTMVK